MIRGKFLLLILILFSGYLHADPVVILNSTDTSAYDIGDWITYKLEVYNATAEEVNWPTPESFKDFDFIKVEEAKEVTINKQKVLVKEYTFSKYEPGQFQFPIIYITVKKDEKKSIRKTKPINIEVMGLQIDTSIDIMPIKAPIEVPLTLRDYLPLILGCAGGLLLIGLLFYLVKKLKDKKENTPPPPKIILPAHVVANEQFEQLKMKKLWQQGEIKAYYSEISEILKSYIEQRFEQNTLEKTTAEIIEGFTHKAYQNENKSSLEKTLQMCDLVKFAKAKPNDDQHGLTLTEAESFVNETKEIVMQESADGLTEIEGGES